MKTVIPIVLVSLVLSACGGGGGSDSGDDNTISVSLPGTALSPEAFANAISTGLYRYEISVQSNFNTTFVNASTTYSLTSSGEADIRGLISTIINSPTSATTDSCTLEGPVTSDPREFGIEDDEVDFSNCSFSYSQISATEFGIAQVCPDLFTGIDIVSSGTLTRISDVAGFDNGSLSIVNPAVTDVAEVTASSDVCGYISRLDTETTITPPFGIVDGFDLNQTDVTIVAPYVATDRIELSISFARSNLATGIYSIGSLPTDGAAANIAEASFSSPNFGVGPFGPEFVFANTGQIEITSVSEDAISGTFDLTLDTLENVTGTFTVDLR